MIKRTDLGYIGEYWTLYQLSLFGIRGTILPPIFDYDIITENDIRIEVKSARPTLNKKGDNVRKVWNFINQKKSYTGYGNNIKYTVDKRDRDCDFFIFVCFNKNNEVETTYIVPNDFIGNKQMIGIPCKPTTSRYLKYKNSWNLITEFKK